MKTYNMTLLLLILLLLSACSTVVKNPTPLPPAAQYSGGIVKEYQIQAGDQLEIKFFYNAELNEIVTVRPDGRVSFQLANEIMAAGLTPSQLTEQLRKRYSAELDKPEITVFVRSFTSQRIYVDGEVNKAGLVTLTPPLTALQSISVAGGLKDSAMPEYTIIIRRTAENKLNTMVVNLAKAIDNTDMSQDLVLMPNDIVYVPKSAIANVNVWVDQYIRRNIPISFSIPSL